MITKGVNKDKMKKVLHWLSENTEKHQGKSRIDLLREAEIRYDLSPRECEFLDHNFAEQ